jgi:predicted enzyme related to lactoylglutathione lyase
MNMNVVGWFEIYVDDMARASAFYSAVFQHEFEQIEMDGFLMHTFPMNDEYGAPGALVKAEMMPAGSNSTVVYFNCADCAVEEARVVAAGGQVMRSKFSIGEHGFCALVNDTEGNLIGLHSMV